MKLFKYIKRFLYCKIHHINKAEYKLLTGGGKLGKNCEIYSSVVFGTEPYLIEIGNNVRITDGVKFVTHDGGLWVLRNMYEDMKKADYFGKIIIKDNVHIGWNTVIMPGVTIGYNCIIGCGAVVTKDIPDNSVAVGVPAKVIESVEDYYNKKKDSCVMTKSLNILEKKKYLLEIFNNNANGGGGDISIVLLKNNGLAA